MQFIVDHLAHSTAATGTPAASQPDAALVASGVKGKPGPLVFSMSSHRLIVLAKWHRLHGWDHPGDAQMVKTLCARYARLRHARAWRYARKSR